MSKMTDEQIKKGLECCRKYPLRECKKCPYLLEMACDNTLKIDLIDLINRQRAEIERFKKIETTVNEFWRVLQKFTREKLKEKPTLEELLEYIEHARAEAIKEFIEEFTSRLEDYKYHDYTHGYFFYKDSIDHLVNYLKKEMVGEGK